MWNSWVLWWKYAVSFGLCAWNLLFVHLEDCVANALGPTHHTHVLITWGGFQPWFSPMARMAWSDPIVLLTSKTLNPSTHLLSYYFSVNLYSHILQVITRRLNNFPVSMCVSTSSIPCFFKCITDIFRFFMAHDFHCFHPDNFYYAFNKL